MERTKVHGRPIIRPADRGGKINMKNSKSGAGEEFLLPFCRGSRKRIVFFTDTGISLPSL